MRHLWILNHYAQDASTVTGMTRHFSLAQRLLDHGWMTTIVSASVEHNTGRQRLLPGESHRIETIDGVSFLWLRTNSYTRNNAQRIRNMAAYTVRALRPATTSALPRPSVVLGSTVHPFAAWAASRLARRHAAAFVYEIRDFWPQTLIDIGSLSSLHPAAAVMRHLERTLCARASRIVSPLPHAARYLTPRGVPASKIVCIPNGVDLDLFPPPAPRSPEPTFTFMYFGAHGRANGLDRLLDAMAYLNAKAPGAPIRLRMVGSGPEKPRLIERAERMGLTGVAFEDPVAKTGVADLGASTDAFIFNLERLDVFRFGISANKLFDYMACGRPIVFCATAPNDIVTEAGAGIAAAPDAESLADAMLALSRMPPGRLREMGTAARTFVEENYAMPSLAARLAAVLDAVAPGAPGERRRHDRLDQDLPGTADTGAGRGGTMQRRMQDGFRVKA